MDYPEELDLWFEWAGSPSNELNDYFFEKNYDLKRKLSSNITNKIQKNVDLFNIINYGIDDYIGLKLLNRGMAKAINNFIVSTMQKSSSIRKW